MMANEIAEKRLDKEHIFIKTDKNMQEHELMIWKMGYSLNFFFI